VPGSKEQRQPTPSFVFGNLVSSSDLTPKLLHNY
jgi:hypothetical protein